MKYSLFSRVFVLSLGLRGSVLIKSKPSMCLMARGAGFWGLQVGVCHHFFEGATF